MRERYDAPFSGFAAIAGKKSFFTVVQDAGPELRAMARAHPQYLSRALKHLAFRIKSEISKAISTGGPTGAKWKERSLMHVYRRMEMKDSSRPERGRLKMRARGYSYRQGSKAWARRTAEDPLSRYFPAGPRSEYRKYGRGGRLVDEEQSLPDAFTRWQTPHGFRKGLRARQAMYGYVQKSIRYQEFGQLGYVIGAVSPQAAMYLNLAQMGRRQGITPKMRIAFWAAGVPLSKGKHVIEQDPRPLVAEVYKRMSPHFEAILVHRIKGYLDGKSSWLPIPGDWNYGRS